MQLSAPRSAWRIPRSWDLGATALPQAQVAGRDALAATRWIKAAIICALISLTLLDRFGLQLTSAYSINPALFALYGLVLALVMTGAARLSPKGALTYIAVVTITALSYLINASDDQRGYVSVSSVLLLLVLYAPIAVSLSEEVSSVSLWQWILKWYLVFALFCAVAGILQFYAQFVSKAPWLFDFRPMLPSIIRGSGVYNSVNPAGELFKSNGFFLREASGFSFIMAFALMCELNMQRRKWAMGLLALGLALSYSGSGLLALAVAMLFQANKKMLMQMLGALVIVSVLLGVFGDVLGLSFTLNRVNEIDSTKSSAYCRFIAPGKLAVEQIDSGRWTALLGHGPGTTQKMYDVCETTYGKVVFEYGLLGTIALTLMIIVAINRSAAPLRLRVMLVVHWFLLGGHLLAPEPLLVIFFLSSMWPKRVGESLPLVRAAPDASRGLFRLKPHRNRGNRPHGAGRIEPSLDTIIEPIDEPDAGPNAAPPRRVFELS